MSVYIAASVKVHIASNQKSVVEQNNAGTIARNKQRGLQPKRAIKGNSHRLRVGDFI